MTAPVTETETALYEPNALAYFKRHAIDPVVAREVGIQANAAAISYRYSRADGTTYERRRRFEEAKTVQPKGEPLTLWWPLKRPERADAVLVAEGEPDALAAVCALRGAPVGYDALPVAGIPGTGFPPAKLAAELAELGVKAAIVVMDGDDAGRKYAEKAKAALAEQGIEPVVVDLLDGVDLADWLVNIDADARGDRLASLLMTAEAVAEDAAPSPATPPAEQPITPAPPGDELLDGIADFLSRFVSLPGREHAHALALFVLHTHAIDAAQATPYLAVTSPERGCGKSLLAEMLEMLCRCAWKLDGLPTEAVLFRRIDRDCPTVEIDEADRLFGAGKDRLEPLIALLNGGNRRGATVPRVVSKGNDFDLVDFSTFSPKVLIGIDHTRWPDTILDRSVVIPMQRLASGESLERMRRRKVEPEAAAIYKACEAWAAEHMDRLERAEPADLDYLTPRAFDGWEPLLAIADQSGGEWPARARAAARVLSARDEDSEQSHGSALLASVRRIMANGDRIKTVDLLAAINADETTPFGGWRHGEGLDSRGLARLLKPYGIKSNTVRTDDGPAKGYKSESFAEAWDRYLPAPTPENGVTPLQASDGAESSVTSSGTSGLPDPLHDPGGLQQIPLPERDVTDVTQVTDPGKTGVGA